MSFIRNPIAQTLSTVASSAYLGYQGISAGFNAAANAASGTGHPYGLAACAVVLGTLAVGGLVSTCIHVKELNKPHDPG